MKKLLLIAMFTISGCAIGAEKPSEKWARLWASNKHKWADYVPTEKQKELNEENKKWHSKEINRNMDIKEEQQEVSLKMLEAVVDSLLQAGEKRVCAHTFGDHTVLSSKVMHYTSFRIQNSKNQTEKEFKLLQQVNDNECTLFRYGLIELEYMRLIYASGKNKQYESDIIQRAKVELQELSEQAGKLWFWQKWSIDKNINQKNKGVEKTLEIMNQKECLFNDEVKKFNDDKNRTAFTVSNMSGKHYITIQAARDDYIKQNNRS